MKLYYLIVISVLVMSCSSDKEVKKMTDKGFQIVVQKYLDEYNKETRRINGELAEIDSKLKISNDSALSINYEEARKKYIEFVRSEKNIKMIKSALEKKESLTKDQVEQLEKMYRETIK